MTPDDLAAALARIALHPAQAERRPGLIARGWTETALGYVAGLAAIETDGGDHFTLSDAPGAETAVICPVFDPASRRLVDALALDPDDPWVFRRMTGVGLFLGAPWPPFDWEGGLRSLTLMPHPRAWLDAGGWRDGPFAACCPLVLDDETRWQVLRETPPEIEVADVDHGQAIRTWIERRPKTPPLPQVVVYTEED